MRELTRLAGTLAPPSNARRANEFRLISRRFRELLNTWLNDGVTTRDSAHNPLSMHSENIARLGLAPGCIVTVESSHGAIQAVLAKDDTLRPGVVLMTHGYGRIDASGAPIDRDPQRGCERDAAHRQRRRLRSLLGHAKVQRDQRQHPSA
nr:molybdopterin dinucleotide binding domain-containing protein [Sphingomonas formosensis]